MSTLYHVEFNGQAHSASRGLTFYDGTMFPAEYRGDLYEDFMTFPGGDSTRGRPVGVVTGSDGALYRYPKQVFRISTSK